MSDYQVRTLPEKTLLNLEALATTVENAEIAIEDVEKMLSNFQLDNLHTSKFKVLFSIILVFLANRPILTCCSCYHFSPLHFSHFLLLSVDVPLPVQFLTFS